MIKTYSITKRLIIGLVSISLVSTITITTLYFVIISDEEKELFDKAEEYKDYLVGSLEQPLWIINEFTITSTGSTFSQNDLVTRLVIRNYKKAIIWTVEY
jgi:hypothetical protein